MLSTPRLCASGLALLALAAIAAPVGRAADEATYDLLGPAPKKGETVTVTTKGTLKDAKVNFDDGTQKLEVGLDSTNTSVRKIELLEVKGRKVQKAKVKVVKDEGTKTISVMGMSKEDEEKSPLAGKTVLVERTKDGWKQTLEDDSDPSDEQKKKMAGLEPDNWEEGVLPAKKVAVGHKWEVEASKLTRLFDSGLSGGKGKIKGRFVKMEKVGGKECAVIELDVDVKGTATRGGEKRKVEYKGKVTLHRSPALGANLKSKADLDIVFSGKQKTPMGEAEVEIKGKVNIETTAAVK